MPPVWVVDKDKWVRAVRAVKRVREYKSKKEMTDFDWGLATHIYKRMGGEIATESIQSALLTNAELTEILEIIDSPESAYAILG